LLAETCIRRAELAATHTDDCHDQVTSTGLPLLSVGAYAPTMGFTFRRRVRTGRTTAVNLSKGGASVSKRVGRVTVNTRGQGRIRIAKGLSFRFKL